MDSRAIGIFDRDYDGDADLWIYGRNYPRLRLLENKFGPAGHFVCIQLEGNPAEGTNRDAIGARVGIEFMDDREPRKITRTLFAGNGFLSESTKTLFFALNKATHVDKITVDWPGSRATFSHSNLAPNRYYSIDQKTNTIKPLPVPVPTRIAADPAVVKRTYLGIRLNNAVPLPILTYETYNGRSQKIQASDRDNAILINLWATWCKPCKTELSSWKASELELQHAGIRPFILNLDALQAESQTTPRTARHHIESLELPFTHGMATSNLVSHLLQASRDGFYRQPPISLPASFLISPDGRLFTFYRGPAEVENILADVAWMRLPETKRKNHTTNFPGRSSAPLMRTHPPATAKTYLDAGYPQDAIDVLKQVIEKELQQPESTGMPFRLSDAYSGIGQATWTLGKPKDALPQFENAIKHNPRSFHAQINRGRILHELGRLSDAMMQWKHMLDISPDHPDILVASSKTLWTMGEENDALSQLERAINVRSKYRPTRNTSSR